ncbi:MAG: PIG-L family deacetylase, partial [Gemmatimonadota bacterium]|nr:PIG-L family deacetylase [Gemmatimonadota bacterium]
MPVFRFRAPVPSRMHSVMRRAVPVLLALLLSLPAAAQESRLPGAIEAGLLLRQADGVKRVLLVAAHPDDEDTALLATLARGWGVEAAYFSFTRGEGGQNLIGTELGEGLGIIRTGELLAARAIDGAAQYFGRAFDFGYSKTAEETFDEWPRELVLSDLVWVIRTFRPHVVISMWGGTSRDGHGHHQAAGVMAREAYEAAGDPDRYPEQLTHAEPWRPLKLYRRTFFDPDAASLTIETGSLDPLLGRSHHQVAMASRSEHRSQGFGTAQTPGPRTTELALVHARVPSEASDPLLAGVDTTLVSLAADLGPEAIADIETYRRSIASVRGRLTATDPGRGLPALARAQRALSSAASRAASGGTPELRRELERRRRLLARAVLALAGVRVQLRARDDVWVPGQEVLVEARVWSGRDAEVTLEPPRLHAPEGWRVRPVGPDTAVEPDDTG